jgi:Ribbon-helix-helix protein, copG family.
MKLKTSVTLSPEAIKILYRLAKKRGISKSAILEVIIREYDA